MADAVHLHDCSGQDDQRLEAHQLQHLRLVVLLPLQEAPLELEGVPVHLPDLLQLSHDRLDLLGSDREERVVCHLEPIDLQRRTVQGDLHDHLYVELVVEPDEDLRA